MKRFGLIGAAGFVAPKHIKAIKDTGNDLVCIVDKSDSVGIIDSFFPNAEFFKDTDITNLKNKKIDYLSVCTPNNYHYDHIFFGLTNNMDVICEKPIVIYPSTIDVLKILEKETGRKVNTILQLRHHPEVLKLKETIKKNPFNKIYDIELTYITGRGDWYFKSWKGDPNKSGGITTNLGIHLFDMLYFLFGDVKSNKVNVLRDETASGVLEFDNVRVKWFLSVDINTIPKNILNEGKRAYRSLKINGVSFDFSEGFGDLHTISYENILNGDGFGLSDVEKTIHIVNDIRNSHTIGLIGDYHPFSVL